MLRKYIVKTFEVGITKLILAEDGRYDMVEEKVCEVQERNLNRTRARAAIIASGHECPRGTDVYWKPISKTVYTFDDANLSAICESVETLPID